MLGALIKFGAALVQIIATLSQVIELLADISLQTQRIGLTILSILTGLHRTADDFIVVTEHLIDVTGTVDSVLSTGRSQRGRQRVDDFTTHPLLREVGNLTRERLEVILCSENLILSVLQLPLGVPEFLFLGLNLGIQLGNFLRNRFGIPRNLLQLCNNAVGSSQIRGWLFILRSRNRRQTYGAKG